MQKRLFLTIIFVIFLFSLITFILILNYLDPYNHMKIWFFSIVTTFILWLTMFLTLIIYFFKKIYYRWRVYILNIIHSIRQSFFISLFIAIIIYFNTIDAPLFLIWFLFFIIFLFSEFFIQNLE